MSYTIKNLASVDDSAVKFGFSEIGEAHFARGALEAEHWLRGRRGWFNMRDVLGL